MNQPVFKNQLYLYGVCTKNEIANYFRNQCIWDKNEDLIEAIKNWEIANQHFQNLIETEQGLPDTIKTREIDDKYRQKIESISKDILFQRSFSTLPIDFKMVEIDKIVACQRDVNLDYVNILLDQMPKNPTEEQVIEFCLSSKVGLEIPRPLQTSLNPPQYVYASKNVDLRFLGMYPKQLTSADIEACLSGGIPVTALTLLIGYGASAMNVISVGKRMILNNGFHRLYLLRKLGLEYAPMVVQTVSNVDLEAPPHFAGLPRDYAIKHKRPSMMKDFFDQKLVKSVKTLDVLKVVKITGLPEQSITPRE